MHVDLDRQDIEILLDAIDYTLERVQNEPGIVYDTRQQKLAALEVVQNKLRRVESVNLPTNT
jgi:hypothetical protein